MPHRQSWFHGTYDKLTNTLSYVLLCHFHLQLPDNRHKWHTHTNPPPITSVVEPSLPQASNPTRQQCHDKWGTVHLRPEPIIAPQPRSPSNHCPAAAGGKGPEPVPHTPLMDSPRAGRGSQSLATNTTKQTQWLTVGLEPGFSGPSLTEQNHCSNPAQCGKRYARIPETIQGIPRSWHSPNGPAKQRRMTRIPSGRSICTQ